MKQRESSFETLRITAMMMVVLLHCDPFVIAASVALTLYFSKLHFTNKTINWLACSSFSIYLLHMNPLLARHFKEIMCSIFDMFDGNLIVYSLVALSLSLLLGVTCMCVDKIRIIVWQMMPLKDVTKPVL